MRERLTDREHWDAQWERAAGAAPPDEGDWAASVAADWFLGGLVARLSGERGLKLMDHYAYHILWDVLYPAWLPRKPGARVIEIGCAPGHHLVEVATRCGYVPYGVDYSEVGVRAARATFEANGFPPENIVQADVFSPEFVTCRREAFDVVMSRGFVEHFADLDPVMRIHADLLAPGGTLMVEVPNLRGVYYPYLRFFAREVLAAHNTEVMRLSVLRRSCARAGLRPVHCDYFGRFALDEFRLGRSSDPLMRAMGWRVRRLQGLANVAYRLLLPSRPGGSAAFSPRMMLVGLKD